MCSSKHKSAIKALNRPIYVKCCIRVLFLMGPQKTLRLASKGFLCFFGFVAEIVAQ